MDPLPGKGLVRAFNVGAQGSMEAAGAPWQALGGLGEIIAATGEKGIALLNKHKELQVQREAANMELEFDQLQQDYELEVLQNPNMTPEQAVQGWQKRTEGFQSKYQRDGMSPMEQDVLATRSKSLIQSGGYRVAQGAMVANIHNAKIAAGNLITRGEMTGNKAMQEAGFAQLRAVVPAEEAERVEIESNANMAISRVKADIAADPEATKARLEATAEDGSWTEYPELDPSRRDTLVRHADAEMDNRRAQEMDALEYAQGEGKLRVQDIEAAHYLTPKDRQALVNALGAKDPPSNEQHGKAWGLLGTLRDARGDPAITDDQYRKLWNEGRGSILQRIPSQWQGDIKKELSYLSPAGRKTHSPESSSDLPTPEDLAAVGTAIASRARDAGIFGDASDSAPFASREKAHRKAEDIRIAVKRFASSEKVLNSDDPVTAVRDFTDKLVSGDTAANAAKNIKLPGSGQRLRIPALPRNTGAMQDPLQVAPGAAGASADLLPPLQSPEDELNDFTDE